jgi:ubiquinone/menaquinone biosynthesis C-methylase UbiE
MGIEIDLLADYPKSKRDISNRGAEKTEADRAIARQFGKEFFDGDRRHGYGGFSYNPRFWQPVIPSFIRHFNLTEESSILDVGCAKGFMLYDFKLMIPGIRIKGIDISSYGIEHGITEIREHLQVANAVKLPFPDKSFEVVISVNTVHNLEIEECALALQEIERVAQGKSFITVDAYRNDDERDRMFAWNLTAKTIMSTTEWIHFFQKVGYTGDYYWFMP